LRNASDPVAQKFSTWVTGLCWIFNGLLRVRPERPEPIVPSQNASTSSSATPAEVSASVDASMSRSSVDLSQCSANGVHPMPTMATLSRIPCEAMAQLPPRSGFAFQK
jgi:hypothetical protein